MAERLSDKASWSSRPTAARQALQRLAEFAFDIIVTDLRLPGIDGRAGARCGPRTLPGHRRHRHHRLRHREGRRRRDQTGRGRLHHEALPVRRAAPRARAPPWSSGGCDPRTRICDRSCEERYRIDGLVGRSRVMRDLFQLLETVAATSSTVLITGETGTGKELVARAIHHNSPRRAQAVRRASTAARFPRRCSRPSCSATCAARSPAPSRTRQGRFEQAHKGTLFLDEVGTMSPALQAKLLRVLQEREFERVGDSHTIKIDVRVIAATHSDLARMVADGTFREDLYYRLNVIPVQLPRCASGATTSRCSCSISSQKLARRVRRRAAGDDVAGSAAPPDGVSLARQRPPARERRRARARVQPGTSAGRSAGSDARGTATPAPPCQASAVPGRRASTSSTTSRMSSSTLIKQSLERTQGNKRQAAKLLNLKRTTLIEKLKRLEPREQH